MEIKQIAADFVKLIREGKNKQAKEQYYAARIASIEGNGERIDGIEAVYQKSAAWENHVQEVHSAHVSEPLVASDHFALHVEMDISYKNGHRAKLNEIAVYQVAENKIVHEQYFFKQ